MNDDQMYDPDYELTDEDVAELLLDWEVGELLRRAARSEPGQGSASGQASWSPPDPSQS